MKFTKITTHDGDSVVGYALNVDFRGSKFSFQGAVTDRKVTLTTEDCVHIFSTAKEVQDLRSLLVMASTACDVALGDTLCE